MILPFGAISLDGRDRPPVSSSNADRDPGPTETPATATVLYLTQARAARWVGLGQAVDELIQGMDRLGRVEADHAWLLPVPFRHGDPDVVDGIYLSALSRMSRVMAAALRDFALDAEASMQLSDLARSVAFSAFQARILTLAAA